MSFRNRGRRSRLEVPGKRSRKLADCRGRRGGGTPLHRAEQRHEPLAEHRHLRAAAPPPGNVSITFDSKVRLRASVMSQVLR